MKIEQGIPLILTLDHPSATLEQVGGKGASLARLAVAGLPVPSGFHISTAAYRRFVTENKLQEEILAAVSKVAINQPVTLEEASDRIGKLFARSPMPGEIANAIRQAYAKLGAGNQPVAVRSSATAEDLPEMSFAGQQETYLNMRGDAMVLDAVKRCWASLWTARAIGYRTRYNISPAEVSLAVVVQELVPANVAGILFTANPLTGVRNQVMINAAWGLGEAIVGGQVTPDTLVVEKASGRLVEQQISEKDVMTVRTPEGTHEEPVPADQRSQATLNPAQAAELARMGVQIESLYGQPMDIEWALHDGHFFMVQARPITTLPDSAQVTQAAEWELPNPKGKYMRSSVIELLPDPLSPLFATLGVPFWNREYCRLGADIGWDDVFNEDFVTSVNGYAYYDISGLSKKSLKMISAIPRMMSFMGKFLGDAHRRWEQESRPQYVDSINRWKMTNLQVVSATDVLYGVREILDKAAKYYISIQAGILPAAYLSEMFLTLVYDRLIRRRNDPVAPTFLLGYRSEPIQAEQSLYDLAQWVRTHEKLAQTLSGMSGTQFLAIYQSERVAGVDEETWSDFRKLFAAHLERFGHAIYDLDFAKAVPADEPVSLLETLKFYLSGKAPDPRKRQEETAVKREQAVQEVITRLKRGPRLKLFKQLLKWSQEYAPLREDALADVGLGWPEIRRMLREVGRRLIEARVIETQDDIFWLTADEVQDAAYALDNGVTPATYQTVVAERRATWKRQSRQTPPVALPIKGGTRFWGFDWSKFMPAHTGQQEGNLIKGIGASAGRITGPARVIRGPDEFVQMQPGDILVAKITTPAWTPLFALAAGIVTDVGGPLSHSSIVAREYHIPAVLGTGVATERLRSGEQITVDGDAGTVTISNS